MMFGRRRDLDRALLGCAKPGEVDAVVAGLRGDPTLRAAYERGALAMRTLEGASVAEVELDWVERWLEADGTLGSVPPSSSRQWWPKAWWIGAAVLAAAVAVVALRPAPPAPLDVDDPLQARGAGADRRAGWLAVSALCDGGLGVGSALVDVSGGACPASANIGFAVRVDGRHHGGDHLVLFGIDGNGEVQYYLPTPEQPAPLVTRRDAWVSLDRAVRLAVNHAPGRLRVYAALLPGPPTLAAIDDAAAMLAARDDDQTPWLGRLGPGHPWLAECTFDLCLGAELEFRIEADTP